MSVSEASAEGKSVAQLVGDLEHQVASRSDANWHEGLKNRTKIALEKINGAFDARFISAEESLNLKQRVYCVQDRLIALALW